MYLVKKQNGALLVLSKPLAGLLNHSSDISNACSNCGKLHEYAFR
jgi:hypothetical protein